MRFLRNNFVVVRLINSFSDLYENLRDCQLIAVPEQLVLKLFWYTPDKDYEIYEIRN
jgi:hypothetical protein